MAIFGDIIQEHFVREFRRNSKLRAQKLNCITTRDQAEQYIAELKEKVRKTFQFPAVKCPLNPRVTGREQFDGFILEKIVIDSRPAFPVTMNLYLPEKIDGKIPALIIDPIHQGERLQCTPDKDSGLCNMHNRFNRKLKSMGDNFCNWRIYDAIRGLDYLLTRPEIDPDRIGVAGNSGGGTMTTLVNACEERFAAAAPSCYITRWQRNVENELPVDAEQIPPAFAANGGEMADLLLAAAPRPLLILGQKDDFFDIRGTSEVYQEVRRIYELLGYADRVRFFAGPCGHGLSIHNRNEIYKFYAEYLNISGVDCLWNSVNED